MYRIIAVVAVASVAACTPRIRTNYVVGQQLEAPVGGEMIVIQSDPTVREDLKVRGSRHDLVYGGVAGGVLKIAYREYLLEGNSAFARPAFGQELQYDLRESNLIVFRNVKLEIVSAANDKIVYRVLEAPAPTATAAQSSEDSAEPRLYR